MISRKNRSTHKIKHVTQTHKTGCGVACIAMIFGISYDEAMKIVHPKRKLGKKPYTSIQTIVDVLTVNKIKYKVQLSDGHSLNIKNPCILGVRWNNDDGKLIIPKGWHWVVLNKKILDPAQNKTHYNLKYCRKKTFIIFEILSAIK